MVIVDQALYAKAFEVTWKNRDLYGYILLRLGTFHNFCSDLLIIGKRFQDAGLCDICIESGILAEGSVSRVIEGKMYNRQQGHENKWRSHEIQSEDRSCEQALYDSRTQMLFLCPSERHASCEKQHKQMNCFLGQKWCCFVFALRHHSDALSLYILLKKSAQEKTFKTRPL